jgi:uncharacterized membrane protein HdeD (DUF308 family)
MEVLGIALIVLGLVSIIFEGARSVASIYLLGILLLASGVAHVANAFGYWRVRWGGFFAGLSLGALYGIAGFLCFIRPMDTLVGLAYLMAVLFLLLGIFRISFHGITQFPAWGWGIVTGIIDLALGCLILAGWPGNSLMVLGILVGIDLFFGGVNALSTGMRVRRLVEHLARAPEVGHRPITRVQH